MSDSAQATLSPWVDEHGRVMERLELHLTYHCTDKCVFCSEEHRMDAYNPYPVTWGRVARVLRQHAARGVRNVHFTGGEPSLHPRFVDVLMLARKLGMRTSMGTIGVRLAREHFARRVVPWLDEALFSLHGPNADIHDALTRRKGSFGHVVQAIKNCHAVNPDFRAYVNTVVTRHNVEALPDTVALADDLGAELIVISNTTPEGGGLDHYPDLAVPLADLKRVLPSVPARAKKSIIRFFGVPMCLLGEYSTLSNDLHWDPRVTVEWASFPGKVVFDEFYNWAPDRKRVQVDACTGCSRKGVCMGVFDRYAELFSTDELVPFG